LPKHIYKESNKVFYQGALFVNGQFVSEAIGEQDYYPNNPQTSYATAAEAAKTDCLTRCCKDLGIAQELWDPQFAIKVWCDYIGKGNGKSKYLWRRKDSPKFTYPHKEQTATLPPNLQKLASELSKNKTALKHAGADAFLHDAGKLIRKNDEITESVLQDWILAMKEHLTREPVK